MVVGIFDGGVDLVPVLRFGEGEAGIAMGTAETGVADVALERIRILPDLTRLN